MENTKSFEMSFVTREFVIHTLDRPPLSASPFYLLSLCLVLTANTPLPIFI